MCFRGLIFKRTWRPSPLYMNSTDRLDALARARVKRHEKWYNWARYVVVGVVILILLLTVCAIISIYVNGDVSSDEWEPGHQDSHMIIKIKQPEDHQFKTDALMQMDSGQPKNRPVRTHSDNLTDFHFSENYDTPSSREERNPNRGRYPPPLGIGNIGHRPPSHFPFPSRPANPHVNYKNETITPPINVRERNSSAAFSETTPNIQSRRDKTHYRPDPHYHPDPHPGHYVPPPWPTGYQSPIVPHPPHNYPQSQQNSPAKSGLIIGNYPQPLVPVAVPSPQPSAAYHPPQQVAHPPASPISYLPASPISYPPASPISYPPPQPPSYPSQIPTSYPPSDHRKHDHIHPVPSYPSQKPAAYPPSDHHDHSHPSPSYPSQKPYSNSTSDHHDHSHPTISQKPTSNSTSDHHNHSHTAPSYNNNTENLQYRHVYDDSYLNSFTTAECEFKCTKDERCIAKSLRCDGRCDCNDGSDETNCECIDRMGTKKLCDGYQDCLYGEDEVGCNGCTKVEFSCKGPYENSVKKDTECIKEGMQCDGNVDCSNGRDEYDCFRLKNIKKDVRGVLSKGILQKKIGTTWYYICGADESEYMLSTVANKVCEIIVGDLRNEEPVVTYLPGSSPEYATLGYAFMGDTDAKFTISNESCPSKQVISIKCPDPTCGYPVSKYETYSISRSHQGKSEGGFYSHRSKKNKYSDDNDLQGKVVGGYDSKHGDYPFACAIYRNGTFHCGCSIVSSEWIITAGHCTHFHDRWTYEIQVGQLRRYSWSPTEQSRMVTEVHCHERYDKRIFLNDIALMKLEHPLYLSKYVATACLADPTQDPVIDQKCTVVGWGDLTEDGNAPDHMQEVDLPVKHCKETFTRETVQICAGYDEGGKDACQGDSGGPFICKDGDGRDILAGLVSFGRGCARAGQLGVYTRISSYHKWINSIITYKNPATEKEDYYPKLCSNYRCLRSGGECVFDKMICDQNVDCLYSEDELSCVYANNIAPSSYDIDLAAIEEVKGAKHASEEHEHTSGGTTLCHDVEEFQCKTSRTCVPRGKKCNGRFDCADFTDERDCDCGTIVKNAFPEKQCDGIYDCPDGSDEEYCEYCYNDPHQVMCPLSKTCIQSDKWCDGMAHCPFGDDEHDCFRISKDKNEVYSEGFLNDRKSRSATAGYVYVRQGETTWKPACAEEFGNKLDDLVCPYLALSMPASSKLYKRNAPWPIHRSTRKTSNKKPTETAAACNKTKVACGNQSCGERRLYSYAVGKSRPSNAALGAHPWTCVVLVEGKVKCLCTILSKQWVAVSDLCLDKSIKTIKDSYVSVRTGPYDSKWQLASPMEQVKRVNYIDDDHNGISFLHLDKSILFDHFSAPICTNFGDYTERRYFPLAECYTVSFVNQTITFNAVKILMNDCSEGSGGSFCADLNYKDCVASENSFVYCTTDPDAISSWYFVGMIGSISGKCSRKINELVVINPFYGQLSEKYQDLISGPAQSVTYPPKCDGTRCPLGNCVLKKHECDKIAQCSDGQDEARCQGTYQIFRASENGIENDIPYENNTVVPCPVGHFPCESTYNCVPISSFCDGKCDCGNDDLTDEPEGKCDCRHYMELIAPDRICDDKGYPDCPDRSDENYCPCKARSFRCYENDYENNCIHANLVCDGTIDCKNGRDEFDCVALSGSLDTLTKNQTKDYYAGYVVLQVRNQWHPYCSHDWSQDLATAVCKKELGYRRLVKLKTFDLEKITQLQKTRGRAGMYNEEDEDDEESDETAKNVFIWYQDEDLLGEYSNKRDEASSNVDDCIVAYIVCGN